MSRSDTGPTTRAERSEATRRAILQAADDLLLAKGEESLSIRRICDRAGVTPPTIYHHFGSRQRLIERIVDDHFAGFDTWLVERPGPADPVDALRWGFDRYVEFGLANPGPYRLLFDQRTPGSPPPHGVSALDRLRRGMAAVDATGRLRLPVDESVLVFWSAMHGVTSLALLGAVKADTRVITEVREAILARLVR